MCFRYLFLALFFAGCSTPYKDLGFGGGVEAQQLTADTYRILSRGNAYTSKTKIQDYTLLKAAETTQQAGGTHFVIMGGEDASRAVYLSTPGTATTTYSGNRAYTSIDPGSVDKLIKPGQDTIIKVLSVGAGQPVPPGAMSADEVIQFVGSRVQRG